MTIPRPATLSSVGGASARHGSTSRSGGAGLDSSATALLNPLWVIGTMFLLQFLAWWWLMPEVPTIPAAAPKYVSEAAVLRYLVFLFTLVASIIVGVAVPAFSGRAAIVRQGPDERQIRMLARVGLLALLLSTVGEVVYTWTVLSNPSLILQASARGDLARAGGIVQGGTVPGVTTLVNLFTVATAIYAAFAFHPAVSRSRRRRAWTVLIVIGTLSVLHGILLSARMFIIWYATTVVAAYLLFADRRRIRRSVILATVIAVAGLVWLGATLRDGGRYAFVNGVGLFTAQTQRQVYDVMVQGYVAADFNNAMITFGCEPTMDVVGTTMFRAATVLAVPGGRFERCAESGQFGTQNSLSLWWQDLGWYGLVYAVLTGLWLGATYSLARRNALPMGVASFLYVVSYPGLVSLLRVNFYGLATFVYPTAFLLAAMSLYHIAGRPLR